MHSISQEASTQYPDYRQRERELEAKNQRLQRLVARLMEQRIRFCPQCGEHWEPAEVTR